jgi:hypothetical protein
MWLNTAIQEVHVHGAIPYEARFWLHTAILVSYVSLHAVMSEAHE